MLTDGIHDNLDPVTRGHTPAQLGVDVQSWAEIPEHRLMKIKHDFLKSEVESILHNLPCEPSCRTPRPNLVADGTDQRTSLLFAGIPFFF